MLNEQQTTFKMTKFTLFIYFYYYTYKKKKA